MPMNLSPLTVALQAKIDALGAASDVKTLLLLAKAIELSTGNVAVSDLANAGATQVGLVNTAGASQVGAINTAGAAKAAAINGLDALLKSGGVMTGALIGDVGVVTDGATIVLDFGMKNNFELTSSGARTMGNPLNPTKGQEGTIEIIGAPVFSWASAWKFSQGVLPTFAGRSILRYRVVSAALIEATVIPNFS
jgi:hypothetical protein